VPVHWSLQLQLHVGSTPLTLCACPLQSCATVQMRVQLGYGPRYPGAHAAQLGPNCTGHDAHELPVHDDAHSHVQPVFTLPLTLAACPLQSVAFVHVR
jgi:hypothetical protein